MKDNSTSTWIIIGILVIALLIFAPWNMMFNTGIQNWGLCGMMGNWNYGAGGYGLGMIVSWLTNIAVLVLIVLGIIWAFQKIKR